MRFILALASLLAIAAAAPAFAQDTAPPAAFTVAGGASLTSDYRFRGISRTDRRAAVQGTLGLSHESGLYVGTWGSSIDDYVAAGSDQEIDLYGGYKKIVNGTTVDGGLLYYFYSGNARGTNTDYFEPYLSISHILGPVGAKAGVNYAWKQKGQSCSYDPRCRNKAKANSLYTYAEVSGAILSTGITVSGHLGESWGRSYLTNGLKTYTDWSVTAAYSWKALTFSASYVDTDVKRGEIVSPRGRNAARAGFVGAVSVTF